MSEPRYSKETQSLIKALALERAEAFCAKSKLSYAKLKDMRFQVIQNAAYFLQPSGVTPKGLTNDMETMPFPVLCVQFDGEKVTVETTEYTEKYLKQ